MADMDGQKKARASLVEERNRQVVNRSLATVKAERAQTAAQGRQEATEAASIQYVPTCWASRWTLSGR
jgi:flagellar biosynthesis regulator FlaF